MEENGSDDEDEPFFNINSRFVALFNLSETVGFSGTAGFSAEETVGRVEGDEGLLAAYRDVYPVGDVTPAAEDKDNFFTPREGDVSEPG
jgi:hypothetical protein